MKTLSLLIGYFSIGLGLFGQSNTYKTVILPMDMQGKMSVIENGIISRTYSGSGVLHIKGSPFLDEDFIPGSIELNNGEKVDNVPMR